MVIKHQRFLDVAFKLDQLCINTKTKLIFRGHWLNMGFVETFDLGIKDTLTIEKEKLDQWLFCVEESLPCIRFSEWKPINKLAFSRY